MGWGGRQIVFGNQTITTNRRLCVIGCVSTGTNAPSGRDLHMMVGGGLPVAEAGGMMRDERAGGGGSTGAAWAGYRCGRRACAAAPHASRADWHRPDPPPGSGRFVIRRKTGLLWMDRASVRPRHSHTGPWIARVRLGVGGRKDLPATYQDRATPASCPRPWHGGPVSCRRRGALLLSCDRRARKSCMLCVLILPGSRRA